MVRLLRLRSFWQLQVKATCTAVTSKVEVFAPGILAARAVGKLHEIAAALAVGRKLVAWVGGVDACHGSTDPTFSCRSDVRRRDDNRNAGSQSMTLRG